MRLINFLNEVQWTNISPDFKPIESSETKNDQYSFKLLYKTLNIPCAFEAQLDPPLDFNENDLRTWLWEIEFGNVNSNGDINTNSLTGSNKKTLVSPSKEALERFPYMFGNVQRCLTIFVEKRKVGGFSFSGGDEFLTKLYSRSAVKKAIENSTHLKFSPAKSSSNIYWYTLGGK